MLGRHPILYMTLLASSAAYAQQGEEEEKPPLKKGPLANPKALTIPGKLPTLQRMPPSTKLRPETLEAFKKGQEGKGEEKTDEPPTKLTAPPPGPEGDNGPSFADLKKAGSKKCKPMNPNDKVLLDFKGDVKELVELISKTTCKNFILTNKVRSQKFEIISPSPITVEEAWRAFLSSLEANDFTLIQVGRYYKIIQATDGTRAPVPMYDHEGKTPIDDRMVTKIWKMKHAGDINAVVNYLNIFKSGKGQIHPFAATNTIIATDFGTSIERLETVLEDIDQPGGVEQVHIVTVEFAGATEIAEKLTQVFEPAKAGQGAKPTASARLKVSKAPEGSPGEKEEEGAVAVSKILADDRTNKLIIISSERAFKQILALLKELDIPQGDDGQIHVLSLKHADAEELASTLSSLAQGKPTTPGRPAIPPGGPPKAAPAPSGGTTASLFQGDVKITADKATNSLVITASKADLASVKRVIEQLDIARYQVFVEATILEVAIKRDRQVGTGWHGGIPVDGPNGESIPILFGNTPNQELSSLLALANPAGLTSLLGFAGVARGPSIPGTEDLFPGPGGIPSVGVVVQALQSSNDVNIISTPHLLTVDNEEAEIQVNEKRPFPSGLSLGGGGLGGLASQLGAAGGAAGALGNLGGLGLGSVSFNREDIGLTLKLKPQINDDEYVRLELDQELSDVAGVDQVTGQTITSKRSAKTVVIVRSQDSVVIGGLVRDRETIDEAKTPILGDLPLLGWLFKRQQKTVEKVNLLLILTPYIIRGPDDFRKIFERKMEERKDFVDRFYGSLDEVDLPQIDWSRKLGPIAGYRVRINKELEKAENEGPGGPDEMIIRPEPKTLDLDLPDAEGEHDGETPEVPPVPVPVPEEQPNP